MRRLASFFLAAYLVAIPRVHAAEGVAVSGLSLLGDSASGSHEYYSSNKENRFLIRVMLLGEVGATGIHYVPDNTTLLDLVALAGGPQSYLDETKIAVHHAPTKIQVQLPPPFEVRADELITNPKYFSFPLANGDTITISGPPKADPFLKTLNLIGAVVGTISGLATIYFLIPTIVSKR